MSSNVSLSAVADDTRTVLSRLDALEQKLEEVHAQILRDSRWIDTINNAVFANMQYLIKLSQHLDVPRF